jgi:hypothetical protein
MFVQTSLVPPLIYPVESFERGSDTIRAKYKQVIKTMEDNDNHIILSKDTEEYLQRMSGEYQQAIPFYKKKRIENSNMISSVLKNIIENPKTFFQKSRYLLNKSHYIKQKGKKIEESNMKGWNHILSRFKGKKKKDYLKYYYNKRTQPPDYKSSYIYFPLHYQPERTTSPEGDIFANQLILVDLLSKCIPKGWEIYVKENQTQFNPFRVGERSRTVIFYDDIVSIPNVRLINLSTSSFELIDHSQAIVTITGTAGWESLLRGKPVLVFGHAWYRDCHGVFYTPSVETCLEAIQKIENGFSVKTSLIRLYIDVLEKKCIRGYVNPAYEAIANVPYKDNITVLTKTIGSCLSKKYIE